MFQLFRLLSWLHSEMAATQAAVRSAQRRHSGTANGSAAARSASSGAIAPSHEQPSNGTKAQDAEQHELAALKAHRHLYDCSVLAERIVAAVLHCLRDVEARLESNGGTMDGSRRALLQEFLQDVIALTVRRAFCRFNLAPLGFSASWE